MNDRVRVSARMHLWIISVITAILLIPSGALAVPTGPFPYNAPVHLTVNPVTNRIYVGTNGSVAVINGNDSTLVTHITPSQHSNYFGVAVNTRTNRIYAGKPAPALAIDIIDGSNNTIIGSIPVGSSPLGIAVNPNTNKAYVANPEQNSVWVIDTVANAIIKEIPVQIGPTELAVNTTTNRVYVVHAYSHYVAVIDGVTDTVTTNIPTSWTYNWAVDVNPGTNRIYVGHNNDGRVSVIDGAANNVVATFFSGGTPFGLAINPTKNRIYVGDSTGDRVRVFDSGTYAQLKDLAVGDDPREIGINVGTGRYYITNAGHGTGNNVSVRLDAELLRNDSLDQDDDSNGSADYWTPKNLGPGDVLDGSLDNLYDGRFSMLFNGSPGVNKQLEQIITTAGPAETVLTLEAFSKSSGTSTTGGNYGARVVVKYVDNTSASFGINFTKGTHGWERKTRRFKTGKAFKELTIRMAYESQSGQAWFDALHVWPIP